MKIFGYEKQRVNESGLLELNEVTFQGDPEKLRMIALFLSRMADAIESNKDQFDHNHITSIFNEWPDDYPEIVVAE